jgi:hypothetical protein
MTNYKRPGALISDRAGEIVLDGTLPLITPTAGLQRHHHPSIRLVGWRVNRWLGVESVEVSRGR